MQPAMDEKFFERQLQSCRTKTEDVSWLEILNYSVQASFPPETSSFKLFR